MKKRNWNLCNVLSAPSGARVLWKFSPDSRGAKLSAERRLNDVERLPGEWVNKGLKTLFGHEKVNIGWLRADQVFVRAVHLPAADLTELHSMLDLQMEKLSPLAAGQMAWTFEPFGSPIDGLQTVILVVLERRVVDTTLTALQGNGFLADKLDLPFLRELAASKFEGDGTWVFLGVDGSPTRCLVAWHYKGTLQAVNLFHLGEGDQRPDRLFEQLTQTIWAGEIEGWLSQPPTWNLIGTDSALAFWQPKFAAWSNTTPSTRNGLKDDELAALTAQHAGVLPPEMTLVPPDFILRYKQALIDRTWMSALFAIGMIYMVVVTAYLGYVEYHRFQLSRAEDQVKSLLKAENVYQAAASREAALLKQADLRKAALRTLRAAAENLPADLTLTKLTLQGGKSLTLFGSAPADQQKAVTEYADAMEKVLDETGSKLFSVVNLPNSQNRPGSAGITWSFSCELPMSSDREAKR